MTTNTTTAVEPVPCRCGHFDRTIRHSCRLTRSLATFRAELLTTVAQHEARLWDDLIGWEDSEAFERFAARVEGHIYCDDEPYYIEDEDGDRAYAEMLERRAEAGTWWGRD